MDCNLPDIDVLSAFIKLAHSINYYAQKVYDAYSKLEAIVPTTSVTTIPEYLFNRIHLGFYSSIGALITYNPDQTLFCINIATNSVYVRDTEQRFICVALIAMQELEIQIKEAAQLVEQKLDIALTNMVRMPLSKLVDNILNRAQ